MNYTHAKIAKICNYNNKFDTTCKKIDYILISVCTYKRPFELKRALKYVDFLDLPQDIKVDVLIVDNDATQSAKEIAEEFKKITKFNVFYFVQEKRGLANVRNKILECAINIGASHIALFDDDEILDKRWLVEHVNFIKNHEQCCISSGPAYYRFDKKYPKYITKNKLFKQPKFKEKEVFQCGCGNVFFPVSVAKQSNIFFDEKFIFTGGEDFDFFNRASIAGYKIFSNPYAIIYQIISQDRANIKNMLRCSYHNGVVENILKTRTEKQSLKYIAKSIINLFLRFLWLFPSLFFGRLVFLNSLTNFIKSMGRINSIFIRKDYEFYK